MRALAAAALLMGFGTAAQAGDGSAVRVLGFSPDGRYFAFEQYGERSGNGQIFSEINTIDVRDDRPEERPIVQTWLPDSDARGRPPEQQSLAQVRQRSAAAAAPTLKRLGITAPGTHVAAVAESRSAELLRHSDVASVREASATAMPVPAGPLGNPGRLTLTQIPIELRRCANRVAEGKPQGIVLALEREGQARRTLTHDRNIPVERGCPDRYGLVAAYAQPRTDGTIALAVVIQYFQLAAAGMDRRFFAVTSAVR